MRQMNANAFDAVHGGSTHWFPKPGGGFTAAGNSALETIARPNGGKVPTEVGPGAIGIMTGAICMGLGSVFGPLGGAAGALLG